jgi:hypothetical protein
MGVRQPLSAAAQVMAPQQTIQGYHSGQMNEMYDPMVSARSTHSRGMNPVSRFPNATPWAFDQVAYNSVLSGHQSRRLPHKTAIVEDPHSAGVAETTWMPVNDGDSDHDSVVRTSNPYMPVAGGSSAAVSVRDRKRLPYVLETRTYASYTGGTDDGAQGLEFAQLFNHPLLANTDESRSDYAEAQVSIPDLIVSSGPGVPELSAQSVGVKDTIDEIVDAILQS